MKIPKIKNDNLLPIIDNTLGVINGIGCLTNLTTWVKTPVDLPNGVYTLDGELTDMPIDDFPVYPVLNKSVSFIPDFDIIPALVECAKFTTQDKNEIPLRPFVGHVNLNHRQTQTEIVGTDAHIMRIKRFETSVSPEIDVSISVEALKTLSEIKELLCLVTVTNSLIEFQFQNTSICSRLMTGKYPDYRVIIPDENTISVNLNHDLKSIIAEHEKQYKADKIKPKYRTYPFELTDRVFSAKYLSMLLPNIPLKLSERKTVAAIQETNDTLTLVIPIQQS